MDDCIVISDDEEVEYLEHVVNLEPILIDLTSNEDSPVLRARQRHSAGAYPTTIGNDHDLHSTMSSCSSHSPPSPPSMQGPNQTSHFATSTPLSPTAAPSKTSPKRPAPTQSTQNLPTPMQPTPTPTPTPTQPTQTQSAPSQSAPSQPASPQPGPPRPVSPHLAPARPVSPQPPSARPPSPQPDSTKQATPQPASPQPTPSQPATQPPKMSDHDLMMAQKALGNEKYKNNLLDDAIRIYRRASDLARKLNNREMSSILHFNLAMTYCRVGSLDQAADECANAVKLNDNYIKAHLKRGEIYQRQRKYEEAVICYEHVCELDSSNSDYIKLLNFAKEAAKRTKKKDYYHILGLNSNFTLEDLKKAYRQKALTHHPDRHSDADIVSRRIQEKYFKEASEAHSYVKLRLGFIG